MRQHFRLLPALLVLSGASLSAQSASEMWRVEGTAHFEQLGEQVGYVADLNGDGFRDLLSQAPTASTGFLSRNGSLQARSGLDGSLLWRVDGTRDGQEWGTTVVRPGDVDGDGVDDFVVVEPVWSSASLAEAGRLTALSGKDGSVLWRREGGASYEGFGRVTKVGDDANGDGAKDILVGAMAASTGGLVENGYAMLLSGRTGGVLWMVAGLNNGEHFGEDLLFKETTDRQNFQARFVLQHPWRGEAACSGVGPYRAQLKKRMEKRAQTLANLTGWSVDEIRKKMDWSVTQGAAGPAPWWKKLWR